MRVCGLLTRPEDVTCPKERRERDPSGGESLHSALLPIDHADGPIAPETGLPERLDRGDRGAAARDHVLDEADRLAGLPEALEARSVPYSLASLRTMRNGSPDASEAEAASATAPSSGPASRSARSPETASAIRRPSSRSSSGSVSKRYLSR